MKSSQSEVAFYQCIKCRGENSRITYLSDKVGLRCDNCKEIVPVVNGIPRFVPSENYANSFGYQWNIHRRTQLDSYTGIPISENRVRELLNLDEDWNNQVVLEAGSGSGRFTEILSRKDCTLYTFDYSNAVEANKKNNEGSGNVNFFQGNIFEMPFKRNSFDKVICLGVLQHTPDPKLAFMKLSEVLKPGGTIAIDVYSKRLRDLIHWKSILRPFTKKLPITTLYKSCQFVVNFLLPPTMALRRIGGGAAARFSPIPEYSHLGLNYNLNKTWSVLDTFDIYSPKFDIPQKIEDVNKWFIESGYKDFNVRYGINGIVATGRK